MTVKTDNTKTRNLFGLRHGFEVCTGARYLGSFIGDGESKRDFLKDRMLKWEKNVIKIRKTAGKYSQESYSAVVHLIQSEWIFFQRVTKNMVYLFAGVDKLLWETFWPYLFFVK